MIMFGKAFQEVRWFIKKGKIEKKLVERLQSNVDKNAYDAGVEAVKHLLPRWEIRTVTELDPIVEETRIIRKFVKEVDDRYHKYVLKKGKEAGSSQQQ